MRSTRAVLLALAGLLVAAPAYAAPIVLGPVPGTVTALATAGDALVDVRQPADGEARVEVWRSWRPVQTVAGPLPGRDGARPRDRARRVVPPCAATLEGHVGGAGGEAAGRRRRTCAFVMKKHS